MKKYFNFKLFIIFYLLLNPQVSNAIKIDNYNIGDTVKDYLVIDNKKKIELPEGDWELYGKYNYTEYGLKISCVDLLQVEKTEILGSLEICFTSMAGVYVSYLNSAIIEAVFKDPYDGCYQRPEYFVLEFYRKGSTHNCFMVSHLDVMKEIYNPDDPSENELRASIRKWLRENPEVKVPPIMLSSSHMYFSRMVSGYWTTVGYAINPKILNAPTTKFLNEDTSEYHKYNIENFPEHKKIMEQWISISANRHSEFEKIFNSKKRHRLKLDKYILNK